MRSMDSRDVDDAVAEMVRTDAGGFAALGVNETLVHTYDITQGLGISWLTPESLCAAMLGPTVPRGSGR